MQASLVEVVAIIEHCCADPLLEMLHELLTVEVRHAQPRVEQVLPKGPHGQGAVPWSQIDDRLELEGSANVLIDGTGVAVEEDRLDRLRCAWHLPLRGFLDSGVARVDLATDWDQVPRSVEPLLVLPRELPAGAVHRHHHGADHGANGAARKVHVGISAHIRSCSRDGVELLIQANAGQALALAHPLNLRCPPA